MQDVAKSLGWHLDASDGEADTVDPEDCPKLIQTLMRRAWCLHEAQRAAHDAGKSLAEAEPHWPEAISLDKAEAQQRQAAAAEADEHKALLDRAVCVTKACLQCLLSHHNYDIHGSNKSCMYCWPKLCCARVRMH